MTTALDASWSLDGTSVALVGVALPFLVGLSGVRSLYRSFKELLDKELVPITHERRGNFVLRLVICWCGVFSVVCPVALWRYIEFFAQLT